eukprot:TRINITY_DN36161_c0_g1_i1.p1 TRINITY_DN36161_c0_g1~~TRINITY_DN36161_c0_g1_i1.p1  ORF type:complete len:1019 (+),score=248.87 TRINITY_DN36161_c0_g1_i1:51-3107(+)
MAAAPLLAALQHDGGFRSQISFSASGLELRTPALPTSPAPAHSERRSSSSDDDAAAKSFSIDTFERSSTGSSSASDKSDTAEAAPVTRPCSTGGNTRASRRTRPYLRPTPPSSVRAPPQARPPRPPRDIKSLMMSTTSMQSAGEYAHLLVSPGVHASLRASRISARSRKKGKAADSPATFLGVPSSEFLNQVFDIDAVAIARVPPRKHRKAPSISSSIEPTNWEELRTAGVGVGRRPPSGAPPVDSRTATPAGARSAAVSPISQTTAVSGDATVGVHESCVAINAAARQVEQEANAIDHAEEVNQRSVDAERWAVRFQLVGCSSLNDQQEQLSKLERYVAKESQPRRSLPELRRAFRKVMSVVKTCCRLMRAVTRQRVRKAMQRKKRDGGVLLSKELMDQVSKRLDVLRSKDGATERAALAVRANAFHTERLRRAREAIQAARSREKCRADWFGKKQVDARAQRTVERRDELYAEYMLSREALVQRSENAAQRHQRVAYERQQLLKLQGTVCVTVAAGVLSAFTTSRRTWAGINPVLLTKFRRKMMTVAFRARFRKQNRWGFLCKAIMLGCCRLWVRVLKRREAVAAIMHLFRTARESRPFRMFFRNFYTRVLRCQRIARSWLFSHRAALAKATRVWVRVETKMLQAIRRREKTVLTTPTEVLAKPLRPIKHALCVAAEVETTDMAKTLRSADTLLAPRDSPARKLSATPSKSSAASTPRRSVATDSPKSGRPGSDTTKGSAGAPSSRKSFFDGPRRQSTVILTGKLMGDPLGTEGATPFALMGISAGTPHAATLPRIRRKILGAVLRKARRKWTSGLDEYDRRRAAIRAFVNSDASGPAVTPFNFNVDEYTMRRLVHQGREEYKVELQERWAFMKQRAPSMHFGTVMSLFLQDISTRWHDSHLQDQESLTNNRAQPSLLSFQDRFIQARSPSRRQSVRRLTLQRASTILLALPPPSETVVFTPQPPAKAVSSRRASVVRRPSSGAATARPKPTFVQEPPPSARASTPQPQPAPVGFL